MRARFLVLMLLMLVTGGCAGDDGAPTNVCGPEGCSAECEQLRGGNCDILDEACRQRILDAVICVRGTPGEMPDVRTITEDEYRAELLAEVASEDGGVEDEPSEGGWSDGLVLLGLLAAGEDTESAALEDQIDGVAGFYEGSTQSITLIDRDEPEDSIESQGLLAHELVHALQDRDVGINELYERSGGSYDSYFAVSCMVEGEANLYEDLAISLLHGVTADPGYWDSSLARSLKYGRRSVVTSSSPYAALWRIRYPIGTRFLTDAWLGGGNVAVQGLYWALPQSTIHWMHGYESLLAPVGQLVRPLACDAAAAPMGFTLVDESSMGPFMVFAFLAHALVDDRVYPTEAAWQDAMQWRQDQLAVFGDEEGRVAVSWRMLFDNAELAQRLANDLGAVPTLELKIIARDAELEVLASDDAALTALWNGTDPEACPTTDD